MRTVLLGRWLRTAAIILAVLLTSVAAHAFDAHGAVTRRSPRLSGATSPLSVRWLAPAEGSTVSGTLSGSSCQVAARDSVGVTSVSFYLDGSLVGTATTPPYACQIDTTVLSGGTHILKAQAHDAMGNTLSAYSFVSVASTGTPGITVTVQGDSLTVGSWWRMPADLGPSFELLSVSAHIGRPAVKGLKLLHEQPLGRVVVFALGTNDWWASPAAYRDHITKVLQLIGPSRCLVVPTIWRGGRANSALNRILHSMARSYGPHRMQLAPWAEAVATGRVLLHDGTHPATQAGWQLREQIVDAAVRACA
jgi:hypothetical protein